MRTITAAALQHRKQGNAEERRGAQLMCVTVVMSEVMKEQAIFRSNATGQNRAEGSRVTDTTCSSG